MTQFFSEKDNKWIDKLMKLDELETRYKKGIKDKTIKRERKIDDFFKYAHIEMLREIHPDIDEKIKYFEEQWGKK